MTHRPLRIYLGDLTYTTLSLATEAFPLNIGFVAAWCKAQFGTEVELSLFKYIDEIDEAINRQPPDILGLSNYPWNFSVGRELFAMTESISPATIRVMGGPNIPLTDGERDQFIRENPLIDFYTYLEGEEAFANIVVSALANGCDKSAMKEQPIEGVIHRRADGDIHRGLFLPRRANLDEIPSPYLMGLMDKFFDGKLSPLLETNRGCPFACTFCHEGNRLLTRVNNFSLERVKAELDYLEHKVPEGVANLMFADPNFGMYERDFEICQHIAGIQRRRNWPHSIFASTGKNRKERIARALRELGGTMKLWMSVQSMDEEVLTQVQRKNIKLEQMMGLAEVFEEMGLPTYSELILALPGETFESHITSIAKVVEAGIDQISTYTLMLLNGTQLNTDESRSQHGLITRFRVLPRDFGKLSNGEVAVEIEEVVVGTRSLAFDDYLRLRGFHLIVNMLYNGKGFGPLFRYFKECDLPVFPLLKALVERIDEAPEPVRALYAAFIKDTREELWDSREELMRFMKREENYQGLLDGRLGANLIQTYQARGLAIMNDWSAFLTTVVHDFLAESGGGEAVSSVAEEVLHFCRGRTHNLWGGNRDEDNPKLELHYDIAAWYAQKQQPLSAFQLAKPRSVRFSFSESQRKEKAYWIERFGTTPTGIGRILTKISLSRLWRNAA